MQRSAGGGSDIVGARDVPLRQHDRFHLLINEQTGVFGLAYHPLQCDRGQPGFIFGIASADVAMDARKPDLLDVGRRLVAPEILHEIGAAFVEGDGMAHDLDRRIVLGVGQDFLVPRPADRAHGVPQAEEVDRHIA